METIEQMLERHRHEVEALQEGCSHPRISDWVEEYWAPGHSTGYLVRYCKSCGKIVERKGETEEGP